MANMHQQSHLSRCKYANRGCKTIVNYEALLLHHRQCGFAPVQCSHHGCEVTVNEKDVAGHQESCEFRSVTCEECHEAMKQRKYEEHICVLRRKLAETTRILKEIQGDQSPASQSHATAKQPGNDLEQPAKQLTTSQAQQGTGILQVETTRVEQIVTRRLASEVVRQPESSPRQPENLLQLTGPCMPDQVREACSISSRSQQQPPVEGEIFLAGGLPYSVYQSYEIFNWSTQQWTLYEDELFFDHTNGLSFLYDNKIMFCGGKKTNRVECLDIGNNRSVFTLPIQLPSVNCGKGVLCGDRILTFGESVSETSLRKPFRGKVLVRGEENKFSSCGIARVNESAVVVVGGSGRRTTEYKDSVLLYNPSTNVIKKLAPLPYGLRDMAVVVHEENLIILGGNREGRGITNDVLMYNVIELQCSRLPSMLEKRSNCAAVIMGKTIVVFGGESRNEHYVSLKTAEYLVLGDNTWKKLPPMHRGRVGATACVLP